MAVYGKFRTSKKFDKSISNAQSNILKILFFLIIAFYFYYEGFFTREKKIQIASNDAVNTIRYAEEPVSEAKESFDPPKESLSAPKLDAAKLETLFKTMDLGRYPSPKYGGIYRYESIKCRDMDNKAGSHQMLAYNFSKLYQNKKVGIVIAGNAGLPGGQIAAHYNFRNPNQRYGGIQGLHPNRRLKYLLKRKNSTSQQDGQEENILTDWLLASIRGLSRYENKGGEIDLGKLTLAEFNERFTKNGQDRDFDRYVEIAKAFKKINKKWGLKKYETLIDYTETMTIQGIDYYNNNPPDNSEIYRLAYILNSQPLRANINENIMTETFDVSLIWTFGPQANLEKALKKSKKSLGRTFERHLDPTALDSSDAFKITFKRFVKRIQVAYEAALDIAIEHGVEILILPRLSGGIYAGPFFDTIQGEYDDIIQNVLQSPPHGSPSSAPRSKYFFRVCYL